MKSVLKMSRMQILLVLLFGLFAGTHAAYSQASRPQGPCDIYASAGAPCVAAHSTTRALYAAYSGPLYQVIRHSDRKTLDIGVAKANRQDAGGYADAPAQDAFCRNTYCWISVIYDQSPKGNHLTQAPRGGFSGPALGGFNNLPIADAAPVTVMGHKVYGVFIVPGMGLRNDNPKGTAVDDQAEGQYWVINGRHFNSGCCFDYGNAEIDSRDDDNGTMETTYYGDTLPWYHGNPPGPWVMTDQENNLVGCVNADGSKLCKDLPNITWRFVTAMAKGEPHHWASLGGDAQQGKLQVMFDGPRVDASYDPMRKQGAILLGNGGDNSNASQGTFYEAAMTASGTFPSDATDQLVQANVVAAHYKVASLSIAPAAAKDMPPGLQTFHPGATQATAVSFTNTAEDPASDVRLTLKTPGKGWSVIAGSGKGEQATIAGPVAPGQTVSVTFQVKAGSSALQGDMLATATWKSGPSSTERSETTTEKIRSVNPVTINEFRVSGGTGNQTDSFIELHNSGTAAVDLSRWTLTPRPTQQAVASTIQIPSGTQLQPGGFYLLGLANSGLAVPAAAGDTVLHVRNTAGISVGDTVRIGDGKEAETRRVTAVGTAAGDQTTLWQPLPDGPVMTMPAGSTNIPVQSTEGLVVGQKLAIGYGAAFPFTEGGMEKMEVATVTAVGKPGTQAYLAMLATAGGTNLKVTSVENISVGDAIRLDIDSPGHGIETVMVRSVGTQAHQTNLSASTTPGGTRVTVRRTDGIAKGDHLWIGTPATLEEVTVSALSADRSIEFTPALKQAHVRDEWVVSPGTGLELAAPLKYAHAANLPFSARGTGITVAPATRMPHSSNEPVQALGTGITLDHALGTAHVIHAPVRDAAVKTAGYQGTPEPQQWFGGPELTTRFLQFGRPLLNEYGSFVLRDGSGVVVDSVNYGMVVDPWAAEGYQAVPGAQHNGCYAPAPGAGVSAGRRQDGRDTDSNCDDFAVEPVTTLVLPARAGAASLKVADVRAFQSGQTIRIGEGADQETVTVAAVGTAGGTTLSAAVQAGQTDVPLQNAMGFVEGQQAILGNGADAESVVVKAVSRRPNPHLTLSAPTRASHAAGTEAAGTGLILALPLKAAHEQASGVGGHAATPGAPNHYEARVQ